MYANAAQTQFREIAKSASVKICNEQDVLLGSGFFVLPHVVLTCWHVIENSDIHLRLYTKKGSELNLQAAIERIETAPESDLALIHLKKENKQAEQFCLWLDDKAKPEQPCYTFGYSRDFENGDSILTSYVGRVSDDREWHKVKDDRISSGFSGSALINLRYGNALGVISESLDTDSKLGGVAIPTEVIFENFPWLEVAQNDYFQNHLLWKNIKSRLVFDYEEVDGVERIDELFLTYQSESPQRAFIPDDFYLANPSAQWWGIIHDLAIDKSIFPAITESIATRFHLAYPIAAILYGSGGMGKSTTARKLLYHFHKDYECWWIDDQLDNDNCATFFENLLPELLSDSQAKLLVLDDWGKLDEGVKSKFKSVFKRILKQRHTHIKFVVTGRRYHINLKELAREWRTPDTDYYFNQAAELAIDNQLLVERLAKVMSKEFADFIAREFTSETIAKAKPFHLLFILFRTIENTQLRDKLTGKAINAQNYFSSIIEYDINSLYADKQKHGFVYALILLAYIQQKFNAAISKETFLQIADYYSDSPFSLKESYTKQELKNWDTMRFYLSETSNAKWGSYLRLSKDEFKEGLLKIYLQERFCDALEYLASWKENIARYILANGSENSASTFAGLFTMKEKLLPQKDVIEQMIAQENTYFNGFADIIFDSKQFAFQQKWNWLDKVKKYANLQDWPKYGAFIQKSYRKNKTVHERTILLNTAKQLLLESQNHEVICICLNLLEGQEGTIDIAKQLLLESENPRVIITCLNLLEGQEGTIDIAKQLVVESQNHDVICICLNLLEGQEGTIDIAKQLVVESQNHEVICICLNLLEGQEGTIDIAKQLVVENKYKEVICICLNLLEGQEGTIDIAKRLVVENKSPHVICTCLKLLEGQAGTIDIAKHLVVENKGYQVICICLNLLEGQEGTIDIAKKILYQTGILEVKYSCLKILKDEEIGQEYALEVLIKWREEDDILVMHSLSILPYHELTKNIVYDIMSHKVRKPYLRYKIIEYGYGKYPIWERQVQKILNNWKNNTLANVANCLNHYEQDLEFTKPICRGLLEEWCNSIKNVKRKRYKQPNYYFIFKAMAHPQLRAYTKQIAQEMLAYEQANRGFLPKNIRERCHAILEHNEFPEWISGLNANLPKEE